ncbi:unnamed protein product [Rotaria magnacalcarata]
MTDDNREEMIAYCSVQFADNLFELKVIEEFEHEYNSSKAIWWYTRNTFLYKMVNKALRVQDIETLYKLRTFIRDLHSQITEYYKIQNLERAEIRCLYRGQGMLKSEFNKIKSNIGGLLSVTNFLSTSANPGVALAFAGESNKELIAIVFEIQIHRMTLMNSPFACIENLSHFGEAEREWLFSMGSVFRILHIDRCEEGKYYKVHLTLSNEQDEELNKLARLIEPKLQIPNPIAVFGILLLEMGKNEIASKFYERALQFDVEPWMRSSLLINLAESYMNMQQFDKALVCLHQSLTIKLQFVASDNWSLSTIYNNLGSVYGSLGESETALAYYEKALEIDLKSQNPDYKKIATRMLNLGSAYFKADQMKNSKDHYQRALSIILEHLPSNHPNMAVVYNSLSTLYYAENNFEESLSMSRKSLDIRLASLSENHPSIAESYINIAITLMELAEEPEEILENYQKAITIACNAFGKNHPTTERYQRLMDNLVEALASNDPVEHETRTEAT